MLHEVDVSAIAGLADAILAPDRDQPLVAVTTRAGSARPLLDAARLANLVEGRADIFLIPTGEATWALTALLPPQLDVYGGAVRVWHPGVSAASNAYDHPLLFIWSESDAGRVLDRVVELVGARAHASAERMEAGTVVEVEVGDLVDYGAFVTLDSGRKGLVHISQLADRFVRHPSEVVEPGDRYRSAVLWDDDRGLALSFVARPERRENALLVEAQAEIEGLRNEVRALAEDRRAALEELRRAKGRVRDLEGRLRGARAPARPGNPARLDEASFLERVRTSYEARYTADDQARYPLRPVSLGAAFVERVRKLDGVPLEKIVDVCVDVAAKRAHEIPGRDVHRLRSGEGGAPVRVRSTDGAIAWRCALQVASPSARRLHWWELPTGGIEVASVGAHDNFSIPE